MELRFDSRSVCQPGHPVTLPRLVDRCSDQLSCSGSSTARIVARRRGPAGRLRHLRTLHLWLQSRIALGDLKLDVVAGESNPADVLTKALPDRKSRESSEHVERGGYVGDRDRTGAVGATATTLNHTKLGKCCLVKDDRTAVTSQGTWNAKSRG